MPLTRGSTTKVRLVNWPIARTTASMSAFTKLSITVSPFGAAAGLAGLAGAVCAATGGTSEVAVIDSAQASAIERDSENPPARTEMRLLVMSTTEVQEGPLAVSPAQQRNQARELRLHAGVGPRYGLCPALEA